MEKKRRKCKKFFACGYNFSDCPGGKQNTGTTCKISVKLAPQAGGKFLWTSPKD
jgi:hypothetical protein